MKLPERIAFTWVLSWGMMEAFLPSDPGMSHGLYSLIPAFSIAYLNDAHGRILYWIRDNL